MQCCVSTHCFHAGHISKITKCTFCWFQQCKNSYKINSYLVEGLHDKIVTKNINFIYLKVTNFSLFKMYENEIGHLNYTRIGSVKGAAENLYNYYKH